MFINLSTIDFNEGGCSPVPPTPPTPPTPKLRGVIYNDNTAESINIYCSDANEEYPQTPTSILIDGEEVINDLKTMAYPSTGTAFTATTVYYLDASGYTNGEHTIEYIFDDRITIIPNMFFALTNIVTVTIPDTVQELHYHLFHDAHYLTGTTIPASVKSLGSQLFYNCYSLTNCTFLGKPTEIPWSCFCNCTGLTSSGLTLDTSEITTIGNYGFAATNLTSVSFPKLESLGDYAFQKSNISSFEATGLTEPIGQYAFQSAFTLTNVVANGSYTSVGRNAFHYCTGLTSVTLADTCTGLGQSAFNQCKSLTGITLPSGLTTMGQYCFNNSGIQSITLPDSITSMGMYALANCKSLTELTFPTELVEATTALCSASTSLHTVVFPTNSKTKKVGNSAFINCTSLTAVTLPTGLTTIDPYAFRNCGELSIVIPSGVTSLGSSSQVFYYTNLKYLEFAEGYNATGATLGFNACPASAGTRTIETLKLPDSFSKNLTLTRFRVTDTIYVGANTPVNSIGGAALNYCKRLIVSDNRQETYSGETVGLYLYRDFSSSLLEEVHFPPKTWLGSNTMFPATLTGANIGNIYVTESMYGSFINCTGLTGDYVLGNCKQIGDYTFENTRISSITITGDTEDCTIGARAFSNNPALTAVTIQLVTVLNSNYDMFKGCTGLTNITVFSTSPNFYLGTMGSLNGEEYSLSNYFQGGTPKTYITGNGFWGCTDLTIQNPNNVFVITDTSGYEFAGCTALTSVNTLFDNGGTVPSNIFSGCTSITALTFDSGVTYINDFGAGSMSSLQSVKLESLTPPTLASNSVFAIPNNNWATVYVSPQAYNNYITEASDPTSNWYPLYILNKIQVG